MINWKVRFSKKNIQFWVRFIGALMIPVLAYLGVNFEDLTTWGAVWDVVQRFFSNPFLWGLTFLNALNIIPDPITPGLGDSQRAMSYVEPGKTKGGVR